MQGTSKPLPSYAKNKIVNLFNAGLGLSDIPWNKRVPKKELFIKLSNTIQSARQLNHFLVEVKIRDNG